MLSFRIPKGVITRTPKHPQQGGTAARRSCTDTVKILWLPTGAVQGTADHRVTAVWSQRTAAATGQQTAVTMGHRITVDTGHRMAVATGQRIAIATGQRIAVATGQRSAVAVGQRSAVVVGQRSTAELGLRNPLITATGRQAIVLTEKDLGSIGVGMAAVIVARSLQDAASPKTVDMVAQRRIGETAVDTDPALVTTDIHHTVTGVDPDLHFRLRALHGSHPRCI